MRRLPTFVTVLLVSAAYLLFFLWIMLRVLQLEQAVHEHLSAASHLALP